MRVRWAYVKYQAEKLLSEHSVQNETGSVDVNEICHKLGFIVTSKEIQSNVSGIAISDNSRKYVIVNPNESPERQRFTIAHELGHHILHEWRLLSIDSDPEMLFRKMEQSSEYDPIEIEANSFAANLLMPEKDITHWFKHLKNKSHSDQEVVAVLAKIFLVSRKAMSYRMENLKLIAKSN